MDFDLEKRVTETISQLCNLSIENIDFDAMDPVAKMMLIALINETQKIHDHIDIMPQRIAERFCSDFIPYDRIGAIPAIVLIKPRFKPQKEIDIVNVGANSTFSYRKKDSKVPLNYLPLFNTCLLPFSELFILTPNKMSHSKGTRDITMGRVNCVWIGITTKAEIERLYGISLLIRGTNGILPEHIYVGAEDKEIDFSTMKEMENLDMAEPFDAQQSSGHFFSLLQVWKEKLLNLDNASLLYFSDKTQDRDLFKPRAYPRIFQQWLEDETLDCFDANTLWIQLIFPEGFIVPDTIDIALNVLPVVNVDVNSLTLTQASPIAKLQKQETSFFLKILETSTASNKQGFNMNAEEVLVRDFDASSYHNGDLYRDIRMLYNRFYDDYYAFIEYNDIKDGEVLKLLRETINRIGKNVEENNVKFKFDSGTYVMRRLDQSSLSSSTKVSYLTTQGEIGNSPKVGEMMENKKLPSIEQKVEIAVAGIGGTDKASVDERYEQLRYYSLTNDRLYTKMDIDAFLRKETVAEFGKEEAKRILISMSIEGTGGKSMLQRGLYIDIDFKDRKNYERAVQRGFEKHIRQKIEEKSCISMPIIVKLKNLEQ